MTNLRDLTKIKTNPVRVGVNLPAGTFDPSNKPGIFKTHYEYFETEHLDYYKNLGCTAIRFGFLWERLQRSLNSPLDTTEVSRIKPLVEACVERDLICVLNPHNYARYDGNLIGSPEVPNSSFADFWKRLVLEFGISSLVHFGLVNEPHGISNTQWTSGAQEAIAKIREVSNNTIYIGGPLYSGGSTLVSSGWVNELKNLEDPANNLIVEVHQYLDSDSSGTNTTVVNESIGVARLQDSVTWCRENNFKVMLGETNAGPRNTSLESDPYGALVNMFSFIRQNSDVFESVYLWAGGPRWGAYPFSLEPTTSSVDSRLRAALDILT